MAVSTAGRTDPPIVGAALNGLAAVLRLRRMGREPLPLSLILMHVTYIWLSGRISL